MDNEPEKKKVVIRSDFYDDFEKTVNEITRIRKRPLLVMFYSDSAGRIMPCDIDVLEQRIDDLLMAKKKQGFTELDLMIHTHGGHADTSYRLIQLIRSYCKKLTILVPTHAHSGGTLMTFGADNVEMGRSATLSPIDVQIGEQEPFTLLSIEKYIEFLEDSANACHIRDEKNRVDFITELTKKLVDQVCPSDLGDLFRLRKLTEQHAKMLLNNYMFKNISQKEQISEQILAKFTKESPSHEFYMDFELVKNSGLIVNRMDEKVYKLSRHLISMLGDLKRAGVICPFYPFSTNQRRPFIKVFEIKGGKKNEE